MERHLSSPTPEQVDALVDAAREARDRAYAPYSRYHVGAAVMAEDGRVVPGANMENASYPLSVCAERGAVQRAVFEGARRLIAVAVVTSGSGVAWPCGGCRQVLNEFGPAMLVVAEGAEGGREERTLAQLLPDAFGPDNLGG